MVNDCGNIQAALSVIETQRCVIAALREMFAEAVAAYGGWIASDAAKGSSWIPALERLDAAMKALAPEAAQDDEPITAEALEREGWAKKKGYTEHWFYVKPVAGGQYLDAWEQKPGLEVWEISINKDAEDRYEGSDCSLPIANCKTMADVRQLVRLTGAA